MRRVPAEGTDVIVHYLATREAGTVEVVHDGGTAVTVVTEHGELLRFQLMATGAYQTADRTCRLKFPAP